MGLLPPSLAKANMGLLAFGVENEFVNILVLNAGSSSQKCCLYHLPKDAPWPGKPIPPLWSGYGDWGHYDDQAELTVQSYPEGSGEAGVSLAWSLAEPSPAKVIQALIATLWSGPTAVIASVQDITSVGHRVVHGGPTYTRPERITPTIKAEIQAAIPFAPLHNPANLNGMTVMAELLGPTVPQVAVFDTAFHRQMPPVAKIYPLPYALFEQGIQRYGFHGISHAYVSHQASLILNHDFHDLALITCHLGNGCSLAAVKNGRCVDTTMGFTPTAGLMMGTRCGDLDPGILVYLARQGYSATALDELINRQSGLVGVSGISSDLREVLAAIAIGNSQAQLAYDLYIYHLQAKISSLIPALGRLDALVFTAGVGENSPQVRRDVCHGLTWLGLDLNETLNDQQPRDQDIAMTHSHIRVLVIHTQEDWAIAQACWENLTRT